MEYEKVVKAVKKILEQYDEPLTLRQIFYRLVSMHIIKNTAQSYKQLSAMLVKAREKGDIPEDKMEDRHRDTVGGDSGYDSPQDADRYIKNKITSLKSASGGFSLARWKDQDVYAEIFIEKDALRRLVAGVAEMYNVKTCISRGYSSYSFLRDTIKRLSKTKPNVILYFGDFDPTGMDIVRDLEERLVKYGATNLTIEKIALTPEQIKKYNLPPAPPKKSDARTKKFVEEFGTGTVELDAIEPEILKKMVKDSIVKHINAKKWNTRSKEEEKSREYIQSKIDKILDKLKGEL